jgi:hypothetical protein
LTVEDNVPIPAAGADETRRFYIVSKIKHAPKWRALRALIERTTGQLCITCSWIDDVETPDFKEAWPRYLGEVVRATNVMVYVERGDGQLKGGLLEIGAALGANIPVQVIGDINQIPALKTARFHPLVSWNPIFEKEK